MNILIAIAYHAGNAAQAERLLDFIYRQSKIPRGHVLLSVAQDVHAEMKKRVQISAEMAFDAVYNLDLRPLADPTSTKNMQVNNAFRQTAEFIRLHFTWPFFWMEPDTVPIVANWIAQLQVEYEMQPRAYFGSQMKAINKTQQEQVFMARAGIYPNAALPEDYPNDKSPFEINAGQYIASRLTPTKRIQQLTILTKEDTAKVREGAILVHGDKNCHLLERLEGELSDEKPSDFESSESAHVPITFAKAAPAEAT